MDNRSITEQIKKMAPALQEAWSALPFAGGRLLVVSMGVFSVQGVVLSRRTGGVLEVVRFVEVAFDTSVRSPKVKMARLMEALGPVPARDVLIVTGEVQFFSADMPELPKRKFGRTDADKLKEAAKWEIAPFLDYPSEGALLSLLRLPKIDEDEEMEEELAKRPAFIFAVSRTAYGNLERLCKAHKKRLIGVLPEESFAFAAGLELEKNGVCLLIDWRMYEVLGALVHNGSPVRVHREPIQGGEEGPDAISRLIHELLGEKPQVDEIIIGGEKAEGANLEDVFTPGSGARARIWNMEDDLHLVELMRGAKQKHCPGTLPPRYMAAMGAAQHYASGKKSGITIDNSVSLKTRLKENVHTLPLVMIGVLLLGMGGEYLYLKQKLFRLEHGIVSFEEQKKELQKAANSESSLKKKYLRLKDKKRDLQKKEDLLLKDIPARRQVLGELIKEITERTPADIMLEKFYQFSDIVYFIEGTSAGSSSITQYVVDLKGAPTVRECRLERSRQGVSKGKDSGSRAGRARSYQFTIRLRLEDPHG